MTTVPTRALALVVSLAAPPLAAQDIPRFGSETRAVEVDVLVMNEGQPVTGLGAADFELLDDGVPQQVELVAGPGAAVNAILALDTSASVAGERLAQLKAAASALLDGLAPGDHGTLMTFSHVVRLVAPATTDVAALRTALSAASAGGGTALNDAVVAALHIADRRHGRPVLMVFSDGEDRLSWLRSEDLLAAAREADAVVYSAQLPPDQADASGGVAYMQDPRGDEARRREAHATGRRFSGERPRSGDVKNTTVLETLADLTGGRVWSAKDGGELRQAFVSLLAEARGRYLLRFEPSTAVPKGWHELQVRARGKGRVRARRGYDDSGGR